MRNVNFKLLWPDGAVVRATMEAETPDLRAKVRWLGAVDRLDYDLEAAMRPVDLQFGLERLAPRLGARFLDESSGEWDAWVL